MAVQRYSRNQQLLKENELLERVRARYDYDENGDVV